MANPIHVNPSAAVRRLTIGGSDWLWVVFTIMILSAVAVFVWSKLVGLFFLGFRSGTFFTGTLY
jgi:bacteriorhodopsin